jgi:transposase
LPPYSPDLNPIEEAFAYVILRHGTDFGVAVESKIFGMLHYLLKSALATISLEKYQGWMGHAGYLCTEF